MCLVTSLCFLQARDLKGGACAAALRSSGLFRGGTRDDQQRWEHKHGASAVYTIAEESGSKHVFPALLKARELTPKVV